MSYVARMTIKAGGKYYRQGEVVPDEIGSALDAKHVESVSVPTFVGLTLPPAGAPVALLADHSAQCQWIKADNTRCGNAAKRGDIHCGVHIKLREKGATSL